MPRNRSSGRSMRPVSRAPPPAPVQRTPPPAPLQQSSNGRGGFGSVIADGMAFGTGSAVAHRAVDSIMGPRTVQHEHAPESQTTPSSAGATSSPANNSSSQDVCINQAKAFEDCLRANLDDIGKCQFYVDMLNECRRRPQSSNTSSDWLWSNCIPIVSRLVWQAWSHCPVTVQNFNREGVPSYVEDLVDIVDTGVKMEINIVTARICAVGMDVTTAFRAYVPEICWHSRCNKLHFLLANCVHGLAIFEFDCLRSQNLSITSNEVWITSLCDTNQGRVRQSSQSRRGLLACELGRHRQMPILQWMSKTSSKLHHFFRLVIKQ